MIALSIRGLRKSYGNVPVLRGIDIDIPAGTTAAILGPSGCGKTTLLRMIAGFERPDAGTILLNGRQVAAGRKASPANKRDVGYVAQEGALFPHLTVHANITFGLARSLGMRARHERAAQLLELVSLDPVLARRYPHQLSGGQQQRVALARALARKPALVLLDEPFSSLDTALRESTRTAIAQALRAEHVTALLVTHDQAEALSMADTIAVMANGTFTQSGPPQQLYHEPATLETALLLGPATILDGKIDSGQAICPLGTLPVSRDLPDGDATIVIRPEHIHVTLADPATGNAIITHSGFYGADTIITAQLPGGHAIRARSEGATTYTTRQHITITVRGPVHAYPR